MDRVSAPETVAFEIAWTDSESFDGSNNLDAIDEPFSQLDPATASLPGLEPILEDRCEETAESSALTGRPDIDSAMLDALRHATFSDHGFPGPGWVAPHRSQCERGQGEGIQLEVVRNTPRGGDATSEPAPPARRPDVDEAMLDALRHAIVSDPRSIDG
jgi:hypothetical protein